MAVRLAQKKVHQHNHDAVDYFYMVVIPFEVHTVGQSPPVQEGTVNALAFGQYSVIIPGDYLTFSVNDI